MTRSNKILSGLIDKFSKNYQNYQKRVSERTNMNTLKNELNDMNNHIAGIKDRMHTLHVVINNADWAIPIGPEISDLISQILGYS